MRLYVGGRGLRGSGYPHAARTLDLLRSHLGIEVVQSASWLPESLHLWKLARMPSAQAAGYLVLLAFGNACSLFRVLVWRRTNPAPVYVPYPSLFFMAWVSLLPLRWRPTCIVDAYISIWDAMFRDRGGNAQGGLSRLVKRVEGRALRAAAVVLVDTQANRDLMVADFGLDPARVRAWPLAIDEVPFLQARQKPDTGDDAVRVLFVGTLIPLHGVAAMLGAMRLLAADPRFEFRIVGDGQLSPLVARFVAECPAVRLHWVREWRSLEQVADEIGAADICLGVFGGEAKASRVLPFKLYMYLAAGKAVVTQAKLSTAEGVPYPPIESALTDGEHEIASAIRRLADDPALRLQRQQQARAYYRQWLANEALVERWRLMLDGMVVDGRRSV